MAEKKHKNRNLFDYLGNILTEKSRETYRRHIEDPEFQTSFQPVVIMNYLSMSKDPRVRQIILESQLSLDRMEKTVLYRYLLKTVPRQSYAFIRYLK